MSEFTARRGECHHTVKTPRTPEDGGVQNRRVVRRCHHDNAILGIYSVETVQKLLQADLTPQGGAGQARKCVCFDHDVSMEDGDHSRCRIELRACPEHAGEQARAIAEAMSSETDPESIQKWRQRLSACPHCECGCAEVELSNVAGWCLHCDHVYVSYSSEIEARHFANDCPGAPDELKESAQEKLVKH